MSPCRRSVFPLRLSRLGLLLGWVIFLSLGSEPAGSAVYELQRCDAQGAALRWTCVDGGVSDAGVLLAVPAGASLEATLRSRDGVAHAADGIVRWSAPQKVRGVEVVRLWVAEGGANGSPELEIDIAFHGGAAAIGEARLRSRLWEPLLHRMILNHAALPPLPTDPRSGEGCDYLILCPSESPFPDWADSIRALRQSEGVLTRVVTTAETGTTWQQIEAFLDDAYQTWEIPPAALLLLGDHPGTGGPGIPAPTWNSYCASDNVYADVDGDDLPDIITARMTARTGAELAAMVGKLLAHERTPSLDPGVYAHPVMAAGWEPQGRPVMEAETLAGFFDHVLGQTPVREYVAVDPGIVWPDPQWLTQFGPAGLGYLPETPEALNDWGGSAARINADINAGAWMVLHRGQGSTTGWGDPVYTTSDVMGLTNSTHPFVLSLESLSGDFTAPQPCLTEALHRGPHGALGLISSTGIGYTEPMHWLYLYLLIGLWPQFMPEQLPVDAAWQPAFALGMAKHMLYAYAPPLPPMQLATTAHLMHAHGDALLAIHECVPEPLQVDHATYCLVGATTFAVAADSGAGVGLTVDGVIVGCGTAAGAGVPVPIPIVPPMAEGELRIVVTLVNHLRHDVVVPIRSAAGVAADPPAVSGSLRLESPSPVQGRVTIRYELPEEGGPMTLRILDAQGRCLRTLADGPAAAGTHQAVWEGRAADGTRCGPGVYFVRLEADGQTQVRRVARVE